MQTIAHEIYPKEYSQLASIITAIQQQDLSKANQLLSTVEGHMAAISSQAQKLQTELFLNAIHSRLDHTHAENLYLVPDEGQQIRMFNFMAEKFPVVRAAQTVANSVYTSKITHQTAFSILDIGIGTGQQMAGLIQRAAKEHPQVQEISIIGIEPSGDSLTKAETLFKKLEQELSIRISFLGIPKTVEQLDTTDWSHIEEQSRSGKGLFFVNASFALHHVPTDFRTGLFQRLKAMQPAALVIIEPYADYIPDDLLTRFQNAWHHYGLTFRAIDTIEAEEEEKCTVKHVFFGREMVDVLSEGERVEQFETAEMWTDRLTQAGFTVASPHCAPSLDFNPVIQMDDRSTYLGLNVNGHPIVAVIGAD